MVSTQWRQIAAGLVLFGISFGYVEAAVVVYLRNIYDPIRREVRPDRPPGELFPLINPGQLQRAAPEKSSLLGVEVVREAATMVMLAAAALVATGGRSSWLAAFALAFGTWDLFFYVFLKMLIDWPASLLTWDILFLIPVPWAAPVLAPCIVAISIIGAGLLALRERVRMRAFDWFGVTFGCLLILASFMWDFRNLLAGGLPHAFVWPLFGAGELLGLGAFLHAYRKSNV
jgi:hypothetical protein